MEKLADDMKDAAFLTQLKEEYDAFLKVYHTDHSILRFQYHKLKRMGERIQEVKLSLREYPVNLTQIPETETFITDDEINADLSEGSGVVGGKGRIYTYWKAEHDTQEKAEFLKKEYGIGGHSSACSGAYRSMQEHDGKGITYQKWSCNNVHLSWTEVAKRIDRLMAKGWYLTEEEQEEQRRIEEARTEPEDIFAENEISEEEVAEDNTQENESEEISAEQVEVVISDTMKTEPVPELSAGNYHITDDHLGEGGPKEKFRRNIVAITLLFQLEAEKRNATKEEQELLAQYCCCSRR